MLKLGLSELVEFKKIYKEEYWIDLSDSEAQHMAQNLINLSKLVLRHNPWDYVR